MQEIVYNNKKTKKLKLILKIPRKLIKYKNYDYDMITTFGLFFNIIIGFILIIFYWSGLHFINVYLQKKYFNWKFLGFLKSLLIIFAVFLTCVTVLAVFVNNLNLLTTILGSLSVLSAALVFTLQDFVAGFFAWIYIEMTGQFRIGDNIQITSNERRFGGWVQHVGFFRTQIRERVGGESLNRERPTGKIITFPNHFIFRYSVTNATKNHKVLWHSFEITTAFENNFARTKEVLQKALTTKFEELILEPSTFFDQNIGDLHTFEPQIFWHIGDPGVVWTIWFGCRIGAMRSVVNEFSQIILETFETQKVILAYPTNRILLENKNQEIAQFEAQFET